MDQRITARSHVAAFSDPHWTAAGEPRAVVDCARLETLWFNTGTLCNIACLNCYIYSSPTNDALVYLTLADVRLYLDEIEHERLGTSEIAFTGGEPFMNPEFMDMLTLALERGFKVLVLTNAMRPMQRPSVMRRLTALIERYGPALTLRVSLDHFTQAKHDAERPMPNSESAFAVALSGMRSLAEVGASLAVAGRTMWGESEADSRTGFATLFSSRGLQIDAMDPIQLVLFPEMDETAAVPEITTACWRILGKDPRDVMCATARMVVRRKGAAYPIVLACTLITGESERDRNFELGTSLVQATKTPVPLVHPHCAKFCVLGGASCSG